MSGLNIIPEGLDFGLKKDQDKLREIIRTRLEGIEESEIVGFAMRNTLRTAWILERFKIKDKIELDKFYSIWLRRLSAIMTVYMAYQDLGIELNIAKKAIIIDDDAHVATSDDAAAAYAYADATVAATAAAYADVATAAAAAVAAAADAAYTDIAYNAVYDIAYDDTYDDTYANLKSNPTNKTLFIQQLDADLKNLNQSLLNHPLWLPKFKIKKPNLSELAPFWNQYIFEPALKGKLNNPKTIAFLKGFLKIPKEYFENKSTKIMEQFITDYLKNNLTETLTARLILLGNGGAGKTSLVKKIVNDDNQDIDLHLPPTPRISVITHTFIKKDIKCDLNIWDFGGQAIMQSTHQFFLSDRSTYIICCNQRANEQPDYWLELLKTRLDPNYQQTIFIVYTHCDYLNKKEASDKKTWRRDATLQRKYSNFFKLYFFNADLHPEKAKEAGVTDLKKQIKQRAIEQAKTPLDQSVFKIKTWVEKREKAQKAYFSFKTFKESFDNKIPSETLLPYLNTAFNFGYVFPEKPIDITQGLTDDFILINQKHWLTYGVYQLINAPEALAKQGILDTNTINQVLNEEKPCYIDKQGEVSLKKTVGEIVCYSKDGQNLLKRIMINYRWGMILNSRQADLLLPLATSLDEPENLAKLINRDDPEALYIEVALSHQCNDFFFKLATYFEPHLTADCYLWRTGAVLYFYGDQQVVALLEMVERHLEITISYQSINNKNSLEIDNEKQRFLQLLLINIQTTLKNYPHINAYSSERVKIGNEYEMISSTLLSHLTNNPNSITTLEKLLLKRGQNMTINFNGSMTNATIATGKNAQVARDNATQNRIKLINGKIDHLLSNLQQLNQDELSASEREEYNKLKQQAESIKQESDKETKELYLDAFINKIKKLTSDINTAKAFGIALTTFLALFP